MKNKLTELIFDFKVARKKILFTKPHIVYQLEKVVKPPYRLTQLF